jgi:hypothetical protein
MAQPESTLAEAHRAYYRKLLGDMVQHGEITGDVAMMVERRWMVELVPQRIVIEDDERRGPANFIDNPVT